MTWTDAQAERLVALAWALCEGAPYYDPWGHDGCQLCGQGEPYEQGADGPHDRDCPLVQARAILAPMVFP